MIEEGSLFESVAEVPRERPLPERMRPRTLDEYAGQRHLVGPNAPLRRLVDAGSVPNCILHGPPGVGKTSLVRLLCSATGRMLLEINAVSARVSDLREMTAEGRAISQSTGRAPVAFVDEIYHFNKQQQNALLPAVETGDLVLVGTTTENPYVEINKTILSRTLLFRLEPLGDADIALLLVRALADRERGLGMLDLEAEDEVLAAVAAGSGGDARQALLRLEALASSVAVGGGRRLDRSSLDLLPTASVRFDRTGDDHYEIISALIKSMRGSDPDAAVYWLARLAVAREDIRFVARRLVIFAAEDVGLADPRALATAASAAYAADLVGWPEAQLILAEAVLYLAAAPKSNSATVAIGAACRAVEGGNVQRVPQHLRPFGDGYRYPHDDPRHWVPQQYMERTERFFFPGALGEEPELAAPLRRFWRRFQEV